MSRSGFCCCATAEEVTTQKVRNPPTPKLQKASGTLDFLFVSVCGLARKDAHTKCTTDSNVAQWLSLLRVITDEAVQSSIAWCANSRGGNRPSKFEVRQHLLKQKQADTLVFLFVCRLRTCTQRLHTNKKKRHLTMSLLEWELTDSNRRPSACKADALNQLS